MDLQPSGEQLHTLSSVLSVPSWLCGETGLGWTPTPPPVTHRTPSTPTHSLLGTACPSLAGPAAPLLVSLVDKLLLEGPRCWRATPEENGSHTSSSQLPWPQGHPLAGLCEHCGQTDRKSLPSSWGAITHQLDTCSLSSYYVRISQEQDKG